MVLLGKSTEGGDLEAGVLTSEFVGPHDATNGRLIEIEIFKFINIFK
jgi:hypothetical protein